MARRSRNFISLRTSEELAGILATQGYSIYWGQQGQDLAKSLDKLVKPEDRSRVYTQIGMASAMAQNIARQRGVNAAYSARYTDPLALIRTLAELRTENMPVEADLRSASSERFPGFQARYKFQVGPEIILAAVLYSAFPFNKKSGEIDPVDAASVSSNLEKVKVAFGEKVFDILRGALMASEINPGGAPSPAYQERNGRTLTDADVEDLRANESERMTRFLGILPQLKIPAESILLRSASYSLYLDDVIANPQAYVPHLVNKAVRDLYIPLDADYRQRAYQDGDVSTANLLHTLKTKYKDRRLRLNVAADYDATRDKILDAVRDLIPEEDRHLRGKINDLRDARAIGLGRIAQDLLKYFTEDQRSNLQIVFRLKDVASVYTEVRKLYADDLAERGGLQEGEKPLTYRQMLEQYFPRVRDLIGFKFIVTDPSISSSASPDQKRQLEESSTRTLNASLHQAIKTNRVGGKALDARDIPRTKFQVIDVRTKILFNPDAADEFFKKRGREDNGYRAIHGAVMVTVGKRSILAETQTVGENQDDYNEYGEGSHDGYKKHTRKQPQKSKRKITVSTDVNEFVDIPRDGSVADFMVALYGSRQIDPSRAFQLNVETLKIKRTVHYYNGSLPAPGSHQQMELEEPDDFKYRRLSERLVPGDKLSFHLESDLANNPQHRIDVIAACHNKETREILKKLDREMLAREAQMSPDRPGEESPLRGGGRGLKLRSQERSGMPVDDRFDYG